MLGILYLSILWVICSGQRAQPPGAGRGYIVPGKQNVAESSKTEHATEPAWVDVLRQNIKTVISNKGIQNAKPDIRDMISNTHKILNRQKYDFTDYSKIIPEGLKQGMGATADTSTYEPLWLQRLKKFVKALIKKKGKKGLEQYVNPIVKRIEKKNNVELLDIDANLTLESVYEPKLWLDANATPNSSRKGVTVNPYGDVSVLWNQNKPPPFTLLGPHANGREGMYRKTSFL